MKCIVYVTSILCFLCIIAGHVCGAEDSKMTPVKIQKMQKNRQMEIIGRYGNSARGNIFGFPVLILRGNYEEMGEAHGALAGKDIIELLDATLIPYVNKIQKDAWNNKIIPASNAFFFPEYYERELNSIITGIRKIYTNKNDRMLHSINREITEADLRALNCISDIMFSPGGCSSFSAWGPLTENGDVICGRNLDERYIPGMQLSFMILAREVPDIGCRATIEISGPGTVGASTAMNVDGLIFMAHATNGLQPTYNNRWVPRSLARREVIESTQPADSVEQIARKFEKYHIVTGSNTHVALDSKVKKVRALPFVIEWDGNNKTNGVTTRMTDRSELCNAIVCTNHFLKRRPKTDGPTDSRMRYERLTKSLNEVGASRKLVDFEKAVRMMDSVSVNGATVTYLSVIGFPKKRKMVIAVSPGDGISATKGEWIEISWEQIFPPS
jgi:hypothetical protein